MADDGEIDTAIEQWKIRRLVKNLQSAKGNGTSMISLIIPKKDDINRINKLLAEEYGTASNIKSRVNRLSVLGAITSTQQRLKLYNRTPQNGLVVYCGTVINEDGKEKKVTIDFEPFKPINTSLYLCDNKFHTEDLSELLESDDRFGFIIMDGNGSLFGVVQGSSREILHKFSVDLPKKHGRGGQSALRFARLRLEKRHNYVRKVGEEATRMFITNDKPNVAGLIMAGSADFKNDLQKNDQLFDPRLAAIVIKTVDVSYGGEPGFNQAIELSSDTLKNVKFVQEKKLVTKYMEEVSLDTGKICFGYRDTVDALEAGAVEQLVVWENLDLTRFELRDNSTDTVSILFLTPYEEKNPKLWKNADGQDLEILDKKAFTEWIVEQYKNFRSKLDFITDKSQEGNQFVKGFGGLGGILRYRMDFEAHDLGSNFDDSDDEDFM